MPSATISARSLSLIVLAIVAFVLVINVRIVAGGKTWDDVAYHTEVAPPRLAAGESIRSLRVPAWWEGTSFGVPLLAEPSHGAFVPATWFASSPRSLDWIQLLHLAWCALGIAVWARGRAGSSSPRGSTGDARHAIGAGNRWLASDPAALVAGLLVVTSGVLVSATIRGALPGLAHLPWIGACTMALAVADTRRDRARLAVALGALLALVALSGVFAAFVDGLLIALVIGVRRVSSRASGNVGSIRWLVGAVVAACAIGAVQWIPAFLQLPHAAGETVHGLPLARLLELIVPGSFGASDPARGVHALAGDHAWAPSLFVGAPLLALAAVRVPPRRSLVVIAALVALALVVGRGGWPGWLGAPELHVGALAIVLGVHAGAGIDALLDGNRRAARALAAAIGFTAIALVALVVLRARTPETAPAIDRALLDGGIGVVLGTVALLLAWRARRATDEGARDGASRVAPIVLALLVLPNAGAHGSIAPVVDRAIVMREPTFATALASNAPPAAAPSTQMGTGNAPVRVFRPAFMHDTFTDLDERIATLAGSSAARWGLVGARSESPARSRHHDKTWLAAAQEGGALLDRFAIGAAMLPSTMVDSPRSKFVELSRRGGWALVGLPVAPVASVVRSWMWQREPDEALGFMFTRGGGTSLHRGTIVLEGAGATGASPLEPSPCAVHVWEPGEIELECTTAGYAVVTSSSMPGWTATVNGEPRAWVTADVLRRAVRVEVNARVAWTYHAPGLVVGLVLAALGVLLLATLLALGARSASEPPELEHETNGVS
ncbi:MAG: hypothetical protein ACKV2T_21970 [Kofleriaceae bacterium]